MGAFLLNKDQPRLFRGVTPKRHAGETSLAVVLAWLAHSGYSLDLDTERNPRTAAAHVPYTVLLPYRWA